MVDQLDQNGQVIHRASEGDGAFGKGRNVLRDPSEDTILRPYDSSFFWLYVYQQFSFPTSPANLAHPGGTSSTIPREAAADTLPLAQRAC
jgi:hypothetical protein